MLFLMKQAHMTDKASQASLAAQTLQRLGYYANKDWIDDVLHTDINKNTNLLIQQLEPTAIIPDRTTPGSIGYDLYHHSDTPIILEPGKMKAFNTDIAIKCPIGTYARIAPRSGLTFKNNLTTLAGVIDPNYRGELKVLLHNFGDQPQLIENKKQIAQLILEIAYIAEINVVSDLDDTE
jgi:dUTP pyrophosphatase